MTTTLVLSGDMAATIAAMTREPVEQAGVLLARRVEVGQDMRLLARSFHPVSAGAYVEQSAHQLVITSDGYISALGAAEADGAVPIWFHTHPGDGSVPLPSLHDRKVDRELADLFQLRSGSGYYGTLIASPRDGDFVFSGELTPEAGPTIQIDRVWETGQRWRLSNAFSSCALPPASEFDRNVRAFGAPVQEVLGSLMVAVVGAGGTGSAVAEQLVRLGVRRILLVDSDTLSASNVTRVYGSTPAKVGRPKVEALGEHLLAIAPNLDCRTVQAMITTRGVAAELRGCDVVFGCTDDNAGRLVLSRFSTYFLTPVIDVGVLLSSGNEGQLSGIDGRVTTLFPGAACLVCRNRVDMARASAEMMTIDEQKRLAAEGYAPALGRVEPAVVAFTTAVAAAAVNELLDRLIGYGPPERPTETLLRIHEREISTNCASARFGHYCHPSQGKWGEGDSAPFLGQLWASE